MVRLYPFYTLVALEIKRPAERIQVFWLARSQNDTKGEDISVLGAYHGW
jgi:hypothetical protein